MTTVDRDKRYRVLALDQSLTSFGVCEYTRIPSDPNWVPGTNIGKTLCTDYEGVKVCTLSPKFTGVQRLAYFSKWLTERIKDFEPHTIVMEGYSFGAVSRGNALTSMGELGGVLKLAMFWATHTVIILPPSSLKLWACGAGNAKKEAVLIAAVRAFGDIPRNNNEADAIWLAEIAYHHSTGTDVALLPNEAKRRVLRELSKPKGKE